MKEKLKRVSRKSNLLVIKFNFIFSLFGLNFIAWLVPLAMAINCVINSKTQHTNVALMARVQVLEPQSVCIWTGIRRVGRMQH